MTRYSYTLIDGIDGKSSMTISTNLDYSEVLKCSKKIKNNLYPSNILFKKIIDIDPSADILIPHTIVTGNY